MKHIRSKKICGHIKHKQVSSGRVLALLSKVIILALAVLYLQACAPALYRVDLKYEPSENLLKTAKTSSDFLVTVAMLNDIRNVDDKLQVGAVTIDGDRTPIVPKNVKVPDAVTASVREYFFKSGYRVSNNIPAWDLKEESINKDWGRILVGGNIDELKITCDDSYLVKTYRAKVKLTLVFANVSTKRIFDTETLESSSSLKDVSFSQEVLEARINAVLSDALERIFTDSKLKKKIEGESMLKS
ncbi:MAG TPA: hypothetical protein VFG29_14700 [Syntrophales bacterium]|nr:hypothetical protein [Syntrophales bacterium]